MRASYTGAGVIPPNLLVHVPDDLESAEGYSFYNSPTPSKERKPYTRSAWLGICVSLSILVICGFVFFTHIDVIRGALASSGYTSGSPQSYSMGSSSGGMRAKPSALPSAVRLQSRLEAEHEAKAKSRGTKASKSKDKEGGSLRKATQPEAKVAAAVPTAPATVPEADLPRMLVAQADKVKQMKFEQHLVMETDPLAKVEVAQLQALAAQYVPLRYGPAPYTVEMKVHFPDSMTDPALGNDGTILLTLAPLSDMPYAVYYFLQIVDSWHGGAFHRNAGHVLQAMANTPVTSLAFQEYSANYPHVKYSLGFAGRPGGPEFYISTVDNVQNHGPGSQGSASEADTCFARVADGIDVVQRMTKQPGGRPPSGFVSPPENFIKITSLRLLR